MKIQKWGNGAAIRINRVLLKQINAKVGVSLVAEVRNGGLFLKPAPEPQYSLDDLLASCSKAKMRLEQVAEAAWAKGIKATVFNCPEIRTNSSDIFVGVELSLFPLLKASKKEQGGAWAELLSEKL